MHSVARTAALPAGAGLAHLSHTPETTAAANPAAQARLADTGGTASFADVVKETRPAAKVRYRHEAVDQDGIDEDARAHATDKFWAILTHRFGN